MNIFSHLATILHGCTANDVRKVTKIEQIERQHPGGVVMGLQDLRQDLVQNEGRAEKIVEHVEV